MIRLFRQVILRQVRAEALRSAITIIGIAAGIAVVLAIRLTNASSIRGFEAALDLTSGRAGLEILGSGFGMDEQHVATLDWLREYGHVSPVIDGDALALVDPAMGTVGPALRAGRHGASRTEFMRVLGVDILRDFPVRDYDVATPTSSSTPGTPRLGEAGPTGTSAAAHDSPSAADILALLVDPGAIVITRAFADRNGLATGDTLRCIIDDRTLTFTVRGLLEPEGPAKLLDGNFILMDIAAAQQAFDRFGRIDRLDVRLHDDVDVAVAETAIRTRLAEGLTVQRPSRRGAQVEQMLAAFHLNLTALSSIALIVGLFLVYNAVSVSVLARRQEIGTLRAIGVTSRQVQTLFLGEAGLFGALGVALGIPLARVLADATVALTSTTVNTLYVQAAAAPPALSATDIALAFAVGVPLSLVAAWLPAREAAGVPPTAVMRGADRALARHQTAGWSWRTALVLLALAAALSFAPPVGGLPLAGYVAAFALVFGASLLMPVVLTAASRVGRPLWYGTLRVGGWLAHANLGGHIARVAVSVAALSMSLAMMVAITVMVGSFRETVVDWVGQTLKADLFVGPASRARGARASTISAEVEAVVRAHPEIVAVDTFRNVTVPYADSQIYLGSGDFAIQRTYGGLRFKAPATADAALGPGIGADAVSVSEPFANRYTARVGDTITLQTAHGPTPFRVISIYYDYSSDRGVVMMDNGTLRRHFGEQRPTGLTVYLKDGTRAAAVRDDLLRAIEGTAGVFIYTNRSLRDEVLRIFDSTFAITYALQVIAILVALLGIVGTLMTLVIERRRELGILRAMGTSKGQVRAMIMGEAAMLGAISQVMGLCVGLLMSLILVYVINLQSFGWTIHLHVPWGSLAQMSALVVVTTLLAGLYPARRAMRDAAADEGDE
jgi:putative ABC transport system permease protein